MSHLLQFVGYEYECEKNKKSKRAFCLFKCFVASNPKRKRFLKIIKIEKQVKICKELTIELNFDCVFCRVSMSLYLFEGTKSNSSYVREKICHLSCQQLTRYSAEIFILFDFCISPKKKQNVSFEYLTHMTDRFVMDIHTKTGLDKIKI